MDTCVIFGAAEFEKLLAPVGENDLIIAADGGLAHTQALGLHPNIVLGDFDSLGYVPAGAQVYPVEKDDTDSMLAVRKGLEAGFRRFVLYGALDGPRVDHTLANFQTLLYLADHGARGYLMGKHQTVTAVKNSCVQFPAGFSGTVSVFCLGADAKGVTLRGLHYGLENGTLTSSFPLGVSNHFTGEAASITVESGSLLVIFDSGNGLPED
jgi:thiamine pyrophosphokinase